MKIVSNSNCIFGLFWNDDFNILNRVLRIKRNRVNHIDFFAYYEKDRNYRPYYNTMSEKDMYSWVINDILIICSSNLWDFDCSCVPWHYDIKARGISSHVYLGLLL